MLLIQILCEFQLNFEKQLQIIHNYMVEESINGRIRNLSGS